jgi:transposase
MRRPRPPVLLRLTAGQTSDYKGAAMMLDALPAAKTMLADRAYDARWFRQALTERGITPCIPPHASRKLHTATIVPFTSSAIASRTCLQG